MHAGLALDRDSLGTRLTALSLLLCTAVAGACSERDPDDGAVAPPSDTPAVPAAGSGGSTPTETVPAAAGTGTAEEPLQEAPEAATTSTSTEAPDQPPMDNGAPEESANDELWCDALGVFRTACQSCHGEELAGGAPFPLVTYEDTQAPGVSDPSTAMHELIDMRVHDDARPMPPLSQPRLTDEELGALETWIAAGAPNAEDDCSDLPEAPATDEPEEVEWPEDCQEIHEIRAHDNGEPYIVPANTEETVDIEIPVPWAGDGRGPVQALAIRPLTNNKRVVHHWILYAGARDFVTSWSPGKPTETFPEDVGVHMPSSGTFRLNMHYYNVGNPNDEPDQSGLEVCITRDPRPYTATTYMFSGPATVPPATRVDNVSTCDVVATEPVHIITSSPHMHSYGVASKLEILHSDGTVEVLEDAPFNWEDQHVTPVDAVVENGDQVRITCTYENTSDSTVRFGSSSEDEMCFNFARYYPMGAFRCTGGSFF